jgi:hypothetical protein
MKGELEQAPGWRLLLLRRLFVVCGAALPVGALHHAVHDAESFAAERIGLQPRLSGCDAPARDRDVLQAFLRDFAAALAFDASDEIRLPFRPRFVGDRKGRQRGLQSADIVCGLGQRGHGALDPGKVDIGAELLDLL